MQLQLQHKTILVRRNQKLLLPLNGCFLFHIADLAAKQLDMLLYTYIQELLPRQMKHHLELSSNYDLLVSNNNILQMYPTNIRVRDETKYVNVGYDIIGIIHKQR